jgi:hypothetical protein
MAAFLPHNRQLIRQLRNHRLRYSLHPNLYALDLLVNLLRHRPKLFSLTSGRIAHHRQTLFLNVTEAMKPMIAIPQSRAMISHLITIGAVVATIAPPRLSLVAIVADRHPRLDMLG